MWCNLVIFWNHICILSVSSCSCSYGGIPVVDDLSHEVGEEDGLGDDGEPGEQVTGAESQQLRRHLQHGEPQQPHGGLNLKGIGGGVGGGLLNKIQPKLHCCPTSTSGVAAVIWIVSQSITRLVNPSVRSSPRPPRSRCPRWRSWCFRSCVGSSVGSSSCVGSPARTGRSCCETAWWEKRRWPGGSGSGGSRLGRSRRRCRTAGGRRCGGDAIASWELRYWRLEYETHYELYFVMIVYILDDNISLRYKPLTIPARWACPLELRLLVLNRSVLVTPANSRPFSVLCSLSWLLSSASCPSSFSISCKKAERREILGVRAFVWWLLFWGGSGSWLPALLLRLMLVNRGGGVLWLALKKEEFVGGEPW